MSTAVKKILPHSIEAEQSVLACVMLDNDGCISGFARLNQYDFYSPSHRIIFEAMQKLINNNKPVDFVTVTEALSASAKLESIGGIDYLNTINNSVASSANFNHYLEILKKNRVLRRLNSAGVKIIEASYSETDENNALQIAEKAIFDISSEDERKDLTPLVDELPGVLDRLDTIQKDPTSIRGLQTGFYAIDRLTNGLQNGEMVIVAARPSVGKTSLGLNMAINAATKNAKKCAIFSLEMSKQSLTQRALCSLAKVSAYKAGRGELDKKEWQNLWLANEVLSKADIYIDDNSVITPVEIMNKCMNLKRTKGLDFVMIDYLGLMTSGSNKRESRQVEVADNSRAIKIMAKELNIPVLLLSQLNRAIETNKNEKPQLSHLRESGAIEQDADVVMFIHKDRADDQADSKGDEDVEVIIRKNRNGPCGTANLIWKGEWTSFINPPIDEQAITARNNAQK